MIMPASGATPVIPSPTTSSKAKSNVQLISDFFEDPSRISDSNVRNTLMTQFESQITRMSTFSPQDNHSLNFTLNGKRYEVYVFKDADTLETFKNNESVKFITSAGPVEKNISSMRGGGSEDNIILLHGYGKIFSFILKEKRLSLGDTENINEINKNEVFKFFHNSLKSVSVKTNDYNESTISADDLPQNLTKSHTKHG